MLTIGSISCHFEERDLSYCSGCQYNIGYPKKEIRGGARKPSVGLTYVV